MNQALKLYTELEKVAQTSFRTSKAKVAELRGKRLEISDATTGSTSYAATIAYFEDRIDGCRSYLLKWKNQGSKESVSDLKSKLKDERKREKEKAKANREKDKLAKKVAKADESSEFDEELFEAAVEATVMAMLVSEDIFDK